jgi:hypothetical protein
MASAAEPGAGSAEKEGPLQISLAASGSARSKKTRRQERRRSRRGARTKHLTADGIENISGGYVDAKRDEKKRGLAASVLGREREQSDECGVSTSMVLKEMDIDIHQCIYEVS